MEGAGQRTNGLYWRALGDAGPSVIFESGFAATHLNWMGLAPRVAEFSRVFVYDRAGYGFSAPRPEPRHVEQCVTELAELAERAGWPAPYLLVGHSFGALIARIFAERHPERTSGLVLVDPIQFGDWWPPSPTSATRLRQARKLFPLLSAAASCGIMKLLVWGTPKVGAPMHPLVEQLVGEISKMPAWTWPIVRRHWTAPPGYRTLTRYIDQLEDSCRRGAEFPDLGDLPITVISGAHLMPHQIEEHRRWAACSRSARHRIAAEGRHWVHLDQPDLVWEAIRDACQTSRPHAA